MMAQVKNKTADRSPNQHRANLMDLDLFRLRDHAHAQARNRDISKGDRDRWQRIADQLALARRTARLMMHAEDREAHE